MAVFRVSSIRRLRLVEYRLKASCSVPMLVQDKIPVLYSQSDQHRPQMMVDKDLSAITYHSDKDFISASNLLSLATARLESPYL